VRIQLAIMASSAQESDQLLQPVRSQEGEVLKSLILKKETTQTSLDIAPPFWTPTHAKLVTSQAFEAIPTRRILTDNDPYLEYLAVIQNAPADFNAPVDQASQSPPAVRFKSTIEEIAPDDTTAAVPAPPIAAPIRDISLGEPGEVTPEQIRDLSKRLKACPLQERRMNIFSYEAFSLPPSRVCDNPPPLGSLRV